MSISRISARKAKLTITAVLCASVCFGGVALAQQGAVPAAGSARTQGLALIYGQEGKTADVPAGVALLEKAVAAGDIRAKGDLGRMLVDGVYVAPDPARGLALLEAAVAAGDVPAMTALGTALLWGGAVPADPARAKALLEQASAAGDSSARALLGEQLVGGWVLPRDVAAGQALLEAGVAAGDVKAQTALSGLLLYGVGLPKDPVRARTLAEAAADKGAPKALRQVGEMEMWGQRDPAGAEALLTRAGKMGDGEAWATLAEGAMYGYLGGGAVSRAKFDGFAAQARAAGNARIEVLDATRQMWGISMAASGPKTLERLDAAAGAGNAPAARMLVQLERDGNHVNIPRNLDAAAAAVTAHAVVLGPDESWRLARSIEAARVHDAKGWAAVAQAVAARPDLASKAFGEDLYKANPNVLFFLLQQKLRAAGLYPGKPTGFATRATLHGVYRACMALPDAPDCGDSVMRADILGAVFAAR